MFECDGCGFTGDLEEVEAHILEVNKDLWDTPGKIVCWGAMEVESMMWQAYHEHGVHPMSVVMGMVTDKAKELGVEL